MRRRYVLTGFALVAVTALVGTAVAGIGGTGDGPSAKSTAKKKGPRGPRGPAGPAGPQGPPGPPGSTATLSHAAALGTAGPATNDIDDAAFEDLVTINVQPPASSILIATGSVQVAETGTGQAIVACRIEIDGNQVGIPLSETLLEPGILHTLSVSQGVSVGAGLHNASIACQRTSAAATAVQFQQGNITAIATST